MSLCMNKALSIPVSFLPALSICDKIIAVPLIMSILRRSKKATVYKYGETMLLGIMLLLIDD
jgi:hypothetical protein